MYIPLAYQSCSVEVVGRYLPPECRGWSVTLPCEDWGKVHICTQHFASYSCAYKGSLDNRNPSIRAPKAIVSTVQCIFTLSISFQLHREFIGDWWLIKVIASPHTCSSYAIAVDANFLNSESILRMSSLPSLSLSCLWNGVKSAVRFSLLPPDWNTDLYVCVGCSHTTCSGHNKRHYTNRVAIPKGGMRLYMYIHAELGVLSCVVYTCT